jgi:hypothetical protein
MQDCQLAHLRLLFPAAVFVHFTTAALAPPVRRSLCLGNRPPSLGWWSSWWRSEISGVELVFPVRSGIQDLFRCASTDGAANERGRVIRFHRPSGGRPHGQIFNVD